MTTVETTIEEKLCQFTKRCLDSQYCLELLRFLGGYPHVRFSELAIVHALDSNPGKWYTKRAIRQLADKGMITISNVNSISLYSLTEDEPLHSLATDLSKLDWYQWQLVLRQTLTTPVD